MKVWCLLLLGILMSCQPAAMSPQAQLNGGSVRDEKNALGDELWNNTWYRAVAPGVLTENVFSPAGQLTIRGYNSDMTARATNYDHDYTYEILSSTRVRIDHDLMVETYSVEFDGNAMRMCDRDNICAIFRNDPDIL